MLLVQKCVSLSQCVFFFLSSFTSCCWSPFLGFLLFLSLCLSRNAMTVNLESSVNAAKTITPYALTWMLATPLMLTSELVYNMCVTHPLVLAHYSHSTSLTLMFFSQTHFDFSLWACQVPGIRGEDPQCELQKGPSTERPVPLGSVPPSHPLWLPERRQLPFCPLRHRAQNLESAAGHRCSPSDTCSGNSRIKSNLYFVCSLE